MSQDNGTTEGFGDVEAQNMDGWARHAGGWAEQPGQHADQHSREGKGQGMTPGHYDKPAQSGTGGEDDTRGEEPYGRRGMPDEYEGTGDRSDVHTGDLGEEGRYGQEQPHLP